MTTLTASELDQHSSSIFDKSTAQQSIQGWWRKQAPVKAILPKKRT